MGLETRDLEVFLSVAEHGSFGRAATALMLTQPSISERVARLERQLGADLFIRSARGTALTVAGEELLPYAYRCTALLTKASEVVQEHARTRRLRIAVHSTFAHRVVPFVLHALNELERRIIVRDAHSEDVLTMVLDGVADICFVVPGPKPRGLRRISLPPDPVVCATTPDHPLARVGTTSVTDWTDTCIAFNAWGSGAAEFLTLLRTASIPQWRWREVSDAHTAAVLARNENHVAVLTRSTIEAELQDGTLVALSTTGLPRWVVALELIHRTTTHNSDPAIAAIAQATRQAQNRRGTSEPRAQ